MNYTPTPEELALLHEVEQLDVTDDSRRRAQIYRWLHSISI